eukprot:gnl/TRDRNA2_/TRDRNA2_174346_c0_seq2.p1 gnl/TRDRNA2_/TRDRNA2_174346_c0~~gnl/TRDRNA2_/TRDRNA2_174346_c0_seq2.p1  ORF type:complete len:276 (+),score=65.32 gnl/TRDRNA2_/TRDRNA2_174346_c0_seq2:698-1525(+)
MHTNIATALLNEIKAREIDRYYELEDLFESQSIGSSVTELEKILAESQRGTMLDKTRALMVLYLAKPALTAAQLDGLTQGLSAAGGDPSGIRYLQHLSSIRNMMVPSLVSNSSGGAAAGGGGLMGGAASLMSAGGLGGVADLVRSTANMGEGLLAKGVGTIKNIVQSKKDLAICQIVEAVMEQKSSVATDNYLYLDPKAPQATGGQEPPRQRAPFRRAIAFVVGGGNYTELQSLHEWAQAHGRSVAYGSTDMVSPDKFLEELSHLGQAMGSGGAR